MLQTTAGRESLTSNPGAFPGGLHRCARKAGSADIEWP